MSLANEILSGTVNGVAAYLAQGADPNEIDEYGFKPLIEAAIARKTDIAEVLLKAGADANSADLSGRSALHWAVENNDLALAKLLLDFGADANAYTSAAEPVLTTAFMRNQEEMKSLLYQHGASLDFSKDYVNGKLIGHRFELTGDTYLANAKNQFILLDLEGFILEFSVRVIRDSLNSFKSNFAAKHLRAIFSQLHHVLDALDVASELIGYQQYTTDLKKVDRRINFLLEQPLLLIPATYQGHAITFIRFGNLFAKCDRGANSQFEGSVVIYRMKHPDNLTPGLLKKVLFQKQDDTFMHVGINQQLGLERIINFPIGPQITGNCSWANVEAAIPTMLFILLLKQSAYRDDSASAIKEAVSFFYEWHLWDQDRSLEQCIQSLEGASSTRRAAKVLLLVNILFQTCHYNDVHNIARAEKIIALLKRAEFKTYLDNYVRVYYHDKKTPAGENLMNLFDIVT